MERFVRALLLVAAIGTLAACSSTNSTTALPAISNGNSQSQTGDQSILRAGLRPGPAMQVCGAAALGFARCHAWIRTDIAGASPSGYNPPDLRTAYSLPSSTAGGGQTVAIVDAYDDPKAESDTGVYRSTFSISACTTKNGCFKKVNQSGVQGSYPRGDRGWAEEISLDLDMVSAICPNCHILLVEATTNSGANLYASVNEAAKLGANEISNSWGGGEYSSEVTDDNNTFNHPGIAITASSGDSGYGAQFPATSKYITTAGGTTLTKSKTGTFSETAWSGAGSGCSAFIARQTWNNTVGGTCSKRSESDVSAVADPNTGVSVYDTFHETGWLVFGGTSVSSPILASVYALAGNASSVTYGSYSYSHTSSLHDITSGSNGSCGTILCNAAPGWDGPTGNGTPNGTGGF